MSRARLRWSAVLACLAVLGAACANGDPASAPTTTTDRPPLGSPPDPGPIPTATGLDDDLLAQVAASTVAIDGVACGRLSAGSGFAVAEDLIATNAHVLVGVDDIRVSTLDGRDLTGIAVAFDADRDLAILEVQDAGLDPLPLGDAVDHTIGALIGWEREPAPDPTPFRIDRPVTVRIESVASTERIERRSWLLAAEVESGDSGAALVDTRGTVVGIAYATSTEGRGVGYAVRATELEALVAEGFDRNLTIPDC